MLSPYTRPGNDARFEGAVFRAVKIHFQQIKVRQQVAAEDGRSMERSWKR